jgi:hypothetical protein
MKFVESRANRIFRTMDLYASADAHLGSKWISASPVGKIFGRYENDTEDFVYIGENGILIAEAKQYTPVFYRELERVEVLGEKTEAERGLLRLHDGRTVPVRIAGGHGRIRDIWEFVRFLNRARSEAQSEPDAPSKIQKRIV